MHGLAAHSHLVRLAVDLQIAHHHALTRIARALGATQDGLHAADELARRERLGHVVVGTELQAEDAVDLVPSSRQHDDRHVGVLPDVAREVEAALAGQHHVEHQQLGVNLLEQEGRTCSVLGDVYFVALLLECVSDDLQDRVLIVDDEYARRRHASSHLRCAPKEP